MSKNGSTTLNYCEKAQEKQENSPNKTPRGEWESRPSVFPMEKAKIGGRRWTTILAVPRLLWTLFWDGF